MDKMSGVRLIAVCGGIASGKSMLATALEACGAKVLSCDVINRQLLDEPEYVGQIASNFNGVVTGGVVDKKALRNIILHDGDKKKLLNSLAHPRIFERVVAQASALGGVVFVEVPLLNSAIEGQFFDKVWFVKAQHDLRVARLMSRDCLSKGDAEKFIAMQEKENAIEEFADRIIVNNGTYNQLCEQIKELYLQELSQYHV